MYKSSVAAGCRIGLVVFVLILHAANALAATRHREGAVAPDAGNWEAFGGLAGGCNGDVYALAASSDAGTIFLGGEFSVCGGTEVSNVVAYNVATGEYSALGERGSEGVDYLVQALLFHGDDLYVG